MKVLWFINVPTNEAAEYLGYQGLNIGGWFEALKEELRKINDISLAIAFSNYDSREESFVINNIKYYKIPYLLPTKGIKSIIVRLTHRLEPLECVNYYLKVVEDFKPDVIQIFGTERNYGLIINKVNVPCIIHIQGVLNEIIKKYFSGISKLDIIFKGDFRRLLYGNSVLHYYYYLKKQSKRELEIFKTCKYFIGRTNWDENIVKQLSPNSLYYHCDEIMREEFYTVSWKANKNNFKRIFSTFGAQNYKGLEILSQVSLILNKIKKINVTFRIGGLSERDEVFKIVVNKYGKEVKNYIKPLGRLKPNEIISEMLKSDLFLHASHIDNSPNSVCEAMLIGVPVVSTDVGGISSLIENNVDGLLVPIGNIEMLTESILKILNNKELAIKLSNNAKNRARARHDKSSIVKNLISIYRKLLDQNK
ncbi:MAG: Glycosyl transferase, group 1 [Ignavibacteriae bacterium]|nr:MAG: Glycosyl transferase, group 1 [Ignavibacteriota bacterium]